MNHESPYVSVAIGVRTFADRTLRLDSSTSCSIKLSLKSSRGSLRPYSVKQGVSTLTLKGYNVYQWVYGRIIYGIHIQRWPGSSVGIATDYGMDGPGSNPGGDEIFRPSRPALGGPPSLLYNGYRVFPGGKVRPGRAADHSTPSSVEVLERVEP